MNIKRWDREGERKRGKEGKRGREGAIRLETSVTSSKCKCIYVIYV